MPEPIKITVIIEGGCCVDVLCDQPFEYTVEDHDSQECADLPPPEIGGSLGDDIVHDDDDEPENENCLAGIGMRCPKCKSDGPFSIAATTYVKIYDGGVDDYESFEWLPESDCMCIECHHEGTVTSFAEKAEVAPVTEPIKTA